MNKHVCVKAVNVCEHAKKGCFLFIFFPDTSGGYIPFLCELWCSITEAVTFTLITQQNYCIDSVTARWATIWWPLGGISLISWLFTIVLLRWFVVIQGQNPSVLTTAPDLWQWCLHQLWKSKLLAQTKGKMLGKCVWLPKCHSFLNQHCESNLYHKKSFCLEGTNNLCCHCKKINPSVPHRENSMHTQKR